MLSRVRMLLRVSAFAATAWAGAATSAAQAPAETFRDVLSRQAAFTPDELGALEREGLVVKILPAVDKREVAFCGVARLQGTPDAALAAFKGSLTLKNGGGIRAGGVFGTPPAPEDLATLTLEKREVEGLKRCAAGDCKLKLTGAMIERLRGEADWAAPDHPAQAARLFRSLLADRVRDYLARGDAALADRDGRAKAARPGDEEQRSLLGSLPYLNESAPEFADYLRSFPRRELAGVENRVHWSRFKLGLKPVIVVTHTATYARRHENAPQILAATKQLYANHYFDSSLSLTLVTSAPSAGGAAETYLLYVNRTRADTFDGLFGGLKRRLVEGEVLDNLRGILQQTRQSARLLPASQSAPGPEAGEGAGARPWALWLLGSTRFYLALLLAGGTLLLWHFRRDAKRTARW